jgi:16S rRNA G966 N2-methylase RsmD
LKALGLEARSELLIGSASLWLGRLAAANRTFDLVLVDPPYADPEIIPVLEDLVRKHVLAAPGVVAWEHDRRATPPPEDLLVQVDERRYGDTVVTLLRARDAPVEEP